MIPKIKVTETLFDHLPIENIEITYYKIHMSNMFLPVPGQFPFRDYSVLIPVEKEGYAVLCHFKNGGLSFDLLVMYKFGGNSTCKVLNPQNFPGYHVKPDTYITYKFCNIQVTGLDLMYSTAFNDRKFSDFILCTGKTNILEQRI